MHKNVIPTVNCGPSFCCLLRGIPMLHRMPSINPIPRVTYPAIPPIWNYEKIWYFQTSCYKMYSYLYKVASELHHIYYKEKLTLTWKTWVTVYVNRVIAFFSNSNEKIVITTITYRIDMNTSEFAHTIPTKLLINERTDIRLVNLLSQRNKVYIYHFKWIWYLRDAVTRKI